MAKSTDKKQIEALTHNEARRRNIPTAEYQPVMAEEDRAPKEVRYARGGAGLEDEKAARDADLDPQLVWRGKDRQDWSDLVVQAPPLFIQEKIHPKVLIDDLLREREKRIHHEGTKGTKQEENEGTSWPSCLRGENASPEQLDLFADFNGIPEGADKTEFYRHDANWTNRMILGDSLQVMASLAEREGLRGKVQCIYIDPPYGIKFNSNFQWSTTSRDVKDGKTEHITREPEQVKAFRDTWRDGIHSYLTYLRDRLTVARDLLTESGSVFVQIGDENLYRVKAVIDEIFGEHNAVVTLVVKKKSATTATDPVNDYLLWYAKNRDELKVRQLYKERRDPEDDSKFNTLVSMSGKHTRIRGLSAEEIGDRLLQGEQWARVNYPLVSQDRSDRSSAFPFRGKFFECGANRHWTYDPEADMKRLEKAERIFDGGGKSLGGVVFFRDWAHATISNIWTEFHGEKFPVFVVQTNPRLIERCIVMTTDPGDLVLDPTCGSGTTAYVAEQWGRRWITIDTSRVALALARARIMGARYPYYLLADSKAGQRKEAEVTRTEPSTAPTHGDIRQGFVYQRVPHITLKAIANNAEIDVIWEQWQPRVQGTLDRLNAALRGHKTPFEPATGGRAGKPVVFDAADDATFTMPSGEVVPAYALMDWEVPREAPADWLSESVAAEEDAPRRHDEHEAEAAKGTSCSSCLRGETVTEALKDFWQARIARQREIDASIAAKADFEYLYDKPFEDKKTVRVAGPFTVESLSPHRVLGVDEDDELIGVEDDKADYEERDFVGMILESLRAAGVQQAHKEDRISFTSLTPWPGDLICAEGRFSDAAAEDSPRRHEEHEEDAVDMSSCPSCLRGEKGERRAAIFVGPEFGTVSRPDLVQAAREAADAGFDVLIACAFSFDAHSADLTKLGRVPILKARMNADLHMATELADTGKGNLFVIFGEPDIDIWPLDDGQVQVKINGVDVFHPQSGEVRSDGPDGIACWFIDTDYNEESFFVRHAYFLGANDPYKALKTTLRAEIDEDAWASLHSDTSRPFPKPASGRIAVKVINHLGDEVMKVFRV
ncbi:site-specific DNA-methyltransferase [Thiohalocapsa halophila]|uniref:site-specific DNA-methyltransferase (adenine-specific) n=1 Tax=Thiohalocapsa halophila TaxID=69359 RepID=A0ABS1CG71_9GAMM|nr:site-specific DNA-methyltransferase [Thiohalocapsa halophila]MBK1630904.1 site-specific DNA-methyltransferase [Thiohalocapsa halophila]